MPDFLLCGERGICISLCNPLLSILSRVCKLRVTEFTPSLFKSFLTKSYDCKVTEINAFAQINLPVF